jgi:pyruvate dehydrogenase E2 component (dihydrolipoamide acetyltransferase)
MVRDLVMPKLGLTMTEGLVSEWRVKPGDRFKAGDVLLVVETEKLANEVEAEADGALVEVTAQAGETIACGETIARWAPEGAAEAPAAATPRPVAPVPPPSPPPPAEVRPPAANGRVIATPLARRRARDLAVDLAGLTGSGPGGRIKAADVEGAASARSPAPASPPAGARRPASAFQRTVARRLTETKMQTPHFYLAAEAEVSALLALRARLKGEGLRLSLTPFILAAVGRCLVDLPAMDAVWEEGEIVTLGCADVGLAIDSPRGLVVPVLRGVGHKALSELGAETTALIAAVRAKGVTMEQLQGGAVTVSNAGMHNVTYMTSIINPGQSMILGVGSVREVFRPDADGAPALRRELGLVLSADHRLFDGVAALRFLNAIIGYIERPERLLAARVS